MEKFLEHEISLGEYITGNRFIDICTRTGATFCKTDYIKEFSSSHHQVFVTHNSDYHITPMRHKNGPSYQYWFAQNKDVDTLNIESIPIGLENMTLR